ncbi:MAG: hypothetical protein QG673_2321 [Pseudomonadota bacterium]|nr:hypothetical protein [Pseudomonadota bacterium]
MKQLLMSLGLITLIGSALASTTECDEIYTMASANCSVQKTSCQTTQSIGDHHDTLVAICDKQYDNCMADAGQMRDLCEQAAAPSANK